MANPFSKGWNYLMQSLDTKIEENADPKVQIQQAAEAARKQHAELTKQAAAVIGNKNQLEMRLNRLQEDAQKLAENARLAIQQADSAATSGDSAKAQELNQTAEVFASQLVTVENELEQTKQMHAGAVESARQAEAQKRQADVRFQEQQQQIQQLQQQVDQAKMQEASARSMQQMNGMQALQGDDSVPTLDGVRDKIEARYAQALGAQELVQGTVQGRMDEVTAAGNDMRATSRLEQIRAEMKGELTAGDGDSAGAAADSTDVSTADTATQNSAETPAQQDSQDGQSNPYLGK